MNTDKFRDLLKNARKKYPKLLDEDLRQRYASERFLARLASSKYNTRLVIKGGFLMGVLFNIEQRGTKDLDTLLQNMDASEDNIEKMLNEITEIDLDDSVHFQLLKVERTQLQREYDGFRAKMMMSFIGTSSVISFDLDIGVGDVVTPAVKSQNIPLIFKENKDLASSFELLVYPIDTILAEKIETMVRLGIRNTRMKDFFDLYLILCSPSQPTIEDAFAALTKTWKARHQNEITEELFDEWQFTLTEIAENREIGTDIWPRYASSREYAKSIDFQVIIHMIIEYMDELKEYALGS